MPLAMSYHVCVGYLSVEVTVLDSKYDRIYRRLVPSIAKLSYMPFVKVATVPVVWTGSGEE